MGGMGSGRRYRNDAADCTENYRSLDVRRWQREGLLTSGQTFNWQWKQQGEIVASIKVNIEPDQVILKYQHRSGEKEWVKEQYSVKLEWTSCNFGGRRAWFLCPAVGCGRRLAILYGGSIFACRHCHQLAYASQRETDYDRAARRADKIRARLEWDSGILNGVGGKPKGMRWETFEKLTAAHDAHVDASLVGAMRHFDIKIDG